MVGQGFKPTKKGYLLKQSGRGFQVGTESGRDPFAEVHATGGGVVLKLMIGVCVFFVCVCVFPLQRWRRVHLLVIGQKLLMANHEDVSLLCPEGLRPENVQKIVK